MSVVAAAVRFASPTLVTFSAVVPVNPVAVLKVTAPPDVTFTVSTPETVAPVGTAVIAAVETQFNTSAPSPPVTVSPAVNDATAPPAVDSSPAVIVSAPEPPAIVSVPAVSAKACAASVVVVVVVSVAVAVVVVLDPPQAASDSAIIEMPPALAAFLVFLDSQALTSLLVAFIIFGYEKYINTPGLCDISLIL
jgi:hypothetical protein